MKKIIISAMALLMVAVSAFAQTDGLKYRNRFTLSTSDNTPLMLGSIITGGVIGSVTHKDGLDLDDVHNHGCFSLGYQRLLNKHFAVGAEFTYAGARMEFKDTKTNKIADKQTANVYMLMATGHCSYFGKGIFSLGGDLGLGAMTDLNGATSMAFQIDPINLRLGSQRAGGFLRLGFGVKGFATLGADFAF